MLKSTLALANLRTKPLSLATPVLLATTLAPITLVKLTFELYALTLSQTEILSEFPISPGYLATYKTSVSDYDAPKIKIGKLSAENDESLFGYTKLRFIAGETYNPTSKKILQLHNTVRFPSAGGVRVLTYHDGTLYAVCDGITSNKISDNPDDRQIKIFKYDSTNEIWKKEEAQFIRKIDSNTGEKLSKKLFRAKKI